MLFAPPLDSSSTHPFTKAAVIIGLFSVFGAAGLSDHTDILVDLVRIPKWQTLLSAWNTMAWATRLMLQFHLGPEMPAPVDSSIFEPSV